MHQIVENTVGCLDYTTQRLWDRILGLIKQDLNGRRIRKLFVEVRGETGTCRKEIGDLSTAERQSLHPVLRDHVVERLLDRHLAEQGYVDLADKRRAYTKKIENLTPEDLPAVVEADRQRTEQERQNERERASRLKVLESTKMPAMTNTKAEADSHDVESAHDRQRPDTPRWVNFVGGEDPGEDSTGTENPD